jgi:hypothetical protein
MTLLCHSITTGLGPQKDVLVASEDETIADSIGPAIQSRSLHFTQLTTSADDPVEICPFKKTVIEKRLSRGLPGQ